MTKINIALTDNDELYLNRLGNYMIEKADSFNVSSFSSKEMLDIYLSDSTNKVDILILPSAFVTERIRVMDIPLKIILSDGSSYNLLDGFEHVNKYQKAEKLISDMLLLFAERTGRADAVVKGNRNTRIIGVYSPVGGSGKTTLAVAMSSLCASLGQTVLYLSFEIINSGGSFFPQAPTGSMSDVFLALKTKGANIGLKIVSNRFIEPTSKIHYINPPESAMEFNEMTESEVTQLLEQIDSLGEYHMVFIDMQSAFDKFNINLLSACDHIIVPFSADRLSLTKMENFFYEAGLHLSLNNLIPKIHLVSNKSETTGAAAIQACQFVQQKTVEACIPYSPVFSEINNLSHAGDLSQTPLVALYNLIIQT